MKRFFTGMFVTLAAMTAAMAQSPNGYSGLVLNELNGNDKFIELYNGGNETISLNGIYIEKDGKNVWKAGDITLESGKFLLLYSEDVVADHPDYENNGLIFSSGLSAKKEVRVQLFSPSGASLDDFNLVDYSIPAPASYSRYPDGTGPWMYAEATPGYANAQSSTRVEGLEDPEIGDDAGNDTPVDYTGLVLNELNGNDKFIELYNYGSKAISLKGLFIEKDGKNVWKAGDIILESGKFLLLYSEDVVVDHPDYEGSGLVFSSGLSAKKEVQVELFTPAGVSLDNFNLVNYTTPASASYSRYPDGTGPWMYAPATPGYANAASEIPVKGLEGDVEDDDDNTDDSPVDYTGLVLNELNGNDKFIELYNYGSEEINLKGVIIEKDGTNVWKGGNLTIKPSGFILLYSMDVVASEHPEYEGSGLVFSSGLSAKKEVQVELFSPEGDSLDNFNLVNFQEPAPASYSRYPDGTGPWMYADATPGKANVWSDHPVVGLEGDENDNTGIDELISSPSKDDVYYDLYGRKVVNPGKGLYIVNGKKVIIK